LTTAAQPMRQLGQVATGYLLDQLTDKTPPKSLHQKLSAQLVIRSSTAPPVRKAQASGLSNIITGHDKRSRLN